MRIDARDIAKTTNVMEKKGTKANQTKKRLDLKNKI